MDIQRYLKEIDELKCANATDQLNDTQFALMAYLQGASHGLPEGYKLTYDPLNLVNVMSNGVELPIAFITKLSYLQNTSMQIEQGSKPSLTDQISHAEGKMLQSKSPQEQTGPQR